MAAFFNGPVKRVWDSPRAGVPLWIVCGGLAVYWNFSLPRAGYAIGALAVVAGVMSVREMKVIGKITWVALLIVFLLIEFRAIVKDRIESQAEQNTFETNESDRVRQMLATERDNTKQLIDQENKSFDEVLRNDQREFTRSLAAILAAHKEDEENFASVVKKEENLIRAQQDLSEEFSGRLIAANIPTPPNACSRVGFNAPDTAITTLYETNAFVNFSQNGQPITSGSILTVGGLRVIGFDTIPGTNTLALSIDFRDKNNRVLLRLDKNGVVNRSSLILLHPDKSSFLIQGEYGKDFLNIRYINPRTFEVNGKAVYCGRPISLSMITDGCAETAGSSVIEMDEPPCATQP